jgi:dihydroflavonol-4-reductase
MASFWSNRRVFLTGGTGGIGSRLARLMLDLGAEVTVLTRDASRARDLAEAGCKVEEGDVTRPGTFDVAGHDTVVHAAAWVAYGVPPAKRDLFVETNVEGTRTVLAAAEDAGAERFCHVSSTAAIGPTPAGLYGEDRALEGRFPTYQSLYARTKHQAHELVLEEAEDVRVTLPMPSVVLGEGTEAEGLLRSYASGRTFGVKGDTPTGFVHLEDTVDGILAAIERGEGPYVLNDLNLTVRELFELFQQASGIDPPSIDLPVGLLKALSRVVEAPYRWRGKVAPLSYELVDSLEKPHMYSAGRAHEELGWTPNLEAHLARDFERIAETA